MTVTTWTVLELTLGRLRREPRLAVPLCVAGLVVAMADWLRTRDPVPATTPGYLGETLSIQYYFFPTGTVRTVRHVGALPDLRAPYLLWTVGLELLVAVVVGVAGYRTIRRAIGVERRPSSVARYIGLLGLVVFIPRWVGTPTVDIGTLFVALVAIVVVSLVAVRLFMSPVYLVAGRTVISSLRRSVAASRGMGWALFGLIVVFGLGSWGLALLPLVGGFLSTAIVGPFQAVALGILLRRVDPTVVLDTGA